MASQLLTPEAVVLGFDTAGLPTRMLARMIDGALQLALLVGVLTGLGLLSGTGVPDVGLMIAAFFLVPLLLFGYPIALEALWRGRTLGKAALGLRVVTVEGAPIRFRHALIRGGAEIVDLYGLGVLIVAPGIIGAITIAASRRNQRLGDIVAGTLVVRERVSAAHAAATTFAVPPGAEQYAATVDVSGLGGADYQAVRSFLLRAPDLRPQARSQVAVELARSMAARIRHLPPPGVTPELFLAVVAANVQARSGERPAPAAPVPEAVPGGWGAAPSWPAVAATPAGATVPPAAAPAPAPPAGAAEPPAAASVAAGVPSTSPPGHAPVPASPPAPPAGGGFVVPD